MVYTCNKKHKIKAKYFKFKCPHLRLDGNTVYTEVRFLDKEWEKFMLTAT